MKHDTPMAWVKLPNRRQDPRFLKLNFEHKGYWLDLIQLAAEYGTSGLFIEEDGKPLTVEDMALKLRSPIDALSSALAAFEKVHLVSQNGNGIQLVDFPSDHASLTNKRNNERVDIDPMRPDATRCDPKRPTTSESESESESELELESEALPEFEASTVKESAPSDPSTSADEPTFDQTMTGKGLGPLQREVGHLAYRILGSVGLGKPRLIDTCVVVATRIDMTKVVPTLLAACACVYANDKINNKPINAARIIEENAIPPEYYNCKTWTCIPEGVLQTAGISDIRAHIRKDQIKRAGIE